MPGKDDLSGAVDVLSPLAHSLLKLGEESAYRRPTAGDQGNDDARAMLEMVSPEQLLSVPITRLDDARAMLAGLWLWHDWLAESHTISQGIHGPSGALWHAIMHRREGDFSNSKYWYAKAGRHPILPAIGANVALSVNPLPADKSLLRLLRDGWDPDAFVDLVEQISERPEDPRLATVVAIQRTEWRILFDHCTRQATGRL